MVILSWFNDLSVPMTGRETFILYILKILKHLLHDLKAIPTNYSVIYVAALNIWIRDVKLSLCKKR